MLSVWRKGIKEAIFTFARETEKKLPHQRHCHRTSCRSEFVTRRQLWFSVYALFCIKINAKISQKKLRKNLQLATGNFDFLFSSSSSSYSGNFVSKSSSSSIWTLILDQWINYQNWIIYFFAIMEGEKVGMQRIWTSFLKTSPKIFSQVFSKFQHSCMCLTPHP